MSSKDIEDSHGLHQDMTLMLAHQLNRRHLLQLGLGGSVALLTGCATNSDTATTTSSSTSSTSSSSASSSTSSCGVIPQETAGPYPGDGTNGITSNSTINVLTRSGIVRSDLRTSLITGNISPGVPLKLILKLVNTNNACVALSSYGIYVWHCTRSGEYSLYSSDITNEDYLRGLQATDSDGTVSFTTIFPGCYSGRWPHIHFEIYPNLSVATTANNSIRTSQLALPQSICSTIYSTVTGYSASLTNLSQISLATDIVFSDGYTLQVASVTGDIINGYTAVLIVGIAV